MNAIVISLDCVRPEALSCYPESFRRRHRFPTRARTPNIDAVASDGVTFTNALCHAPFTPASHASMFTGLNPYNHGIRGMFNYELNDDVTTMAERFSTAGYDTGGFIGAHALSSEYDLHRGFDIYDEEFDAAYKNWIVGNRRSCEEVTNEALDWLVGRENNYLLFCHYFDAHDGGAQSADDSGGLNENTGGIRGLYNEYVRELDEAAGSPVKRVYRALNKLDPNKNYGRRYHLQEVQRIDEQIGRLVDTLHERDEYEDTAIVILSDHGESFGEHGEYGHRKYIYDTTIRIPMIVKPPTGVDVSPGSNSNVVRAIDVYPTLAASTDIEPGNIDGHSLYEAAADEDGKRRAYAETRLEKSPSNLTNLVTDLVGIRRGRWKLIRSQLDGTVELYDIVTDPNEMQDLADTRPDIRDELAGELDERLADAPTKEDDLLTDAQRADVTEHLEGLGYLS